MMRTHSLQIKPESFLGCYQALKRGVVNIDFIKLSYHATADNIIIPLDELTIKRIDEHIEFIAARGAAPEFATLLFGMISYLERNRLISQDLLTEIIQQQINNGNTQELLIRDGTWDVKFILGVSEFRFPKYDYELKEIVPESIIEIFQSVALCLQSGLYIAALSLALVALETTIWDHLALKGIKKETEFEKYPHPVFASISWDPANGYNLSVSDRNREPKYPATPITFEVEFKRTGSIKNQNGQSLRALNANIEEQYSLLLSDDADATIETKESFGLSVALQRARKEGLLNWDQGLDKTFHILRNNLIHQATDYEDIKISTTNGDFKLGEISKNLDFTLFFINRIKTYISDAYYAIRLEVLNNS